MTAALSPIESSVRAVLDTVFDPELDEPITDLGFVRSVAVDAACRVEVHLRLPTSFCSPNFAWIMAADARDAVRAVPGVGGVTIELDDHHDSGLINRGLADGLDYKQTFGPEAEQSLDALRATFRRKAHVAAVERALTAWLRADPSRTEQAAAAVRIRDLAVDRLRETLVRRRTALGWPAGPDAVVLVDDDGAPVSPAEAPRRLRVARSVRISIDGNAHFCRGLLQTRYPGAELDQAPRPDGSDLSRNRSLLPVLTNAKGPTR
jgi:metal-sulfur cluster biosynthetic enzyme